VAATLEAAVYAAVLRLFGRLDCLPLLRGVDSPRPPAASASALRLRPDPFAERAPCFADGVLSEGGLAGSPETGLGPTCAGVGSACLAAAVLLDRDPCARAAGPAVATESTGGGATLDDLAGADGRGAGLEPGAGAAAVRLRDEPDPVSRPGRGVRAERGARLDGGAAGTAAAFATWSSPAGAAAGRGFEAAGSVAALVVLGDGPADPGLGAGLADLGFDARRAVPVVAAGLGRAAGSGTAVGLDVVAGSGPAAGLGVAPGPWRTSGSGSPIGWAIRGGDRSTH